MAFIIYPKKYIISIFKHKRKRIERWKDDHDQDIKKIKESIPFSQRGSSLFLFLFPYVKSRVLNLQDFDFSSQNASFFSLRSIGVSSKSISQWPSSGCLFFSPKSSQNFTFSPMRVWVSKTMICNPFMAWSSFSKSPMAIHLSKISLLVVVGGSLPLPKSLNGRHLLLKLILHLNFIMKFTPWQRLV